MHVLVFVNYWFKKSIYSLSDCPFGSFILETKKRRNIQCGYKLSEDFVTPGHQTWQCVISSCGVSPKTRFTSHHFQRHYQNCEGASTPQSVTSHKTSLGGFRGNGSIAWTSAVSHVRHTSNAFKVTMKLQTFLFQMVVTSCISVQYLWKYGFAKSSDNLYAPCS